MRFAIEVITILAAFVAGKFYGANVEAKAIALALRLETYGDAKFGEAYNKIKTIETNTLARIKKFL